MPSLLAVVQADALLESVCSTIVPIINDHQGQDIIILVLYLVFEETVDKLAIIVIGLKSTNIIVDVTVDSILRLLVVVQIDHRIGHRVVDSGVRLLVHAGGADGPGQQQEA